VAVIGQTADPDDPELLIGEASYADQGRAKVMARNVGLVRLYADRRDGRLTGAAMVGPGVEHTGHLLAWAIQSGLTATQLLEFPFYHPTVEEGMQPALWEICKNSGLMPAKDDVRLAGA
jgi:dihydrolipoamide dehydrogenase